MPSGAGPLGDLLGQRVGDRLGDERLAAAGRAVEQHALRRPQLVLAEQVGVQVGQLDGVADLLDLALQPADALVVDVGDLLEDQLLDLGLRDPLVDVARPRRRAAASRRRAAARRAAASASRTTRSSSVLPMHQRALAVLEHLLEHHDLADLLEGQRATTLSASLSMTSWPLRSSSTRPRADLHPQLAAAGEDVDRAVVVALRGRRRSRAGGCASRSTSSLSVTICRGPPAASRRAARSATSPPPATAVRLCSRCSTTREDPGPSASLRRSSRTLLRGRPPGPASPRASARSHSRLGPRHGTHLLALRCSLELQPTHSPAEPKEPPECP